MRITFLSSLYPPTTKGGGELSTHYIARGLRELGHEMRVITSGEKETTYTLDGISVQVLPIPLTAKSLFERAHSARMAKALAAAILPDSYDVLHAHDFRTALALSFLEYPRTLVTARDYAQICGSTNNMAADGTECPGCTWSTVWQNHRVAEAAWPRKFFRAWQYTHNIDFRKKAFQSFKHQIFISHAQRDIITKHLDLSHQQTHVIYNPIAPEFLSTPPLLRDQPEIFSLGTVEKYKGVDLLLEAFHKVLQENPGVRLKIVGEGTDKEQYERDVKEMSLEHAVTFVGKVPYDQLLSVYDQAMIVVAPHRWVEPFGRTVIEGMARGKVVVAANSGGPSELIQHGVTGLLAQPQSVPALIEQLSRALTMSLAEREKIGQAARGWVEQHLQPSMIAEQYVSIYQQL